MGNLSSSSEKASHSSGIIDVVKQRGLYLGLSLLFLLPGIIFITLSMMNYETHSPVRLGIDFTGGTILELGFNRKMEQSDIPVIRELFEAQGYPGSVVQIQEPREEFSKAVKNQGEEPQAQVAVEPSVGEKPDALKPEDASPQKEPLPSEPFKATSKPVESTKLPETQQSDAIHPKSQVKSTASSQAISHQEKPKGEGVTTESVSPSVQAVGTDSLLPSESSATEAKPASPTSAVVSILSIRSKQMAEKDYPLIKSALEQKFGAYTLLQRNSVGPTLASELLGNGLMALILAYILIVGYLTFRFQFDYAVCAIVALVHDTITVFGVFSMLGYLFNTEVDSMFITGILTVVGFSVHDTIVVFDRLRENTRRLHSQKLPFSEIANISVNQTLARSINTSLTALLTLLALFFLGGETTRDFVLCMILGIAIGTYSSIFVASAMLTWWRERSSNGSTSGKGSGRSTGTSTAVSVG
jgi:preprotein translocase subunit SecF